MFELILETKNESICDIKIFEQTFFANFCKIFFGDIYFFVAFGELCLCGFVIFHNGNLMDLMNDIQTGLFQLVSDCFDIFL